MIRVLIVEDDSAKLRRVSRCINEAAVDADVDYCIDVSEAKRRLRKRKYDLLVIDISIPLHAESDPDPEGGTHLVEDIAEDGSLLKPDHIVGLTAFEKLKRESSPAFEILDWLVVHYQQESDDWQVPLTKKLQHIESAKKSTKAEKRNFKSDFAVVCALDDPELSSVLNIPWEWKEHRVPHDHTLYYRGVFKVDGRERVVHAAASPRMGMVSAGLLASKMVSSFSPRYLAMTGIAGGMSSRVNIGDVIAVDGAFNHDCGKLIKEGKKRVRLPDPHFINLSPELRACLSQLAADHNALLAIEQGWVGPKPSHRLKIVLGPLASGAAVLADGQSALDVAEQQHRKLCGIDMEAYAVFVAAAEAPQPRPEALVLKGVCDFADEHKADTFQSYSAYVSAQVFAKVAMILPGAHEDK
ncbi:MAG: hypothetical protein U0R19_35710 [Bryobacteraceae bacterium]